MDTLFELIRRLVLLVIFAGFCELLLPRNSFRSYTRMVVGLLVIAMILNPLLELRGTSWNLEEMLGMGDWPTVNQEFHGSSWQQEQSQALVEQQLAEQVKVFMAQDYPGHDIYVDLDVAFDEYGNLTDFLGMEVVLRPKHQGIQPIKPVDIGQAITSDNDGIPGSAELTNSLARQLGVPAAKLAIWVYTDGGDADAR